MNLMSTRMQKPWYSIWRLNSCLLMLGELLQLLRTRKILSGPTSVPAPLFQQIKSQTVMLVSPNWNRRYKWHLHPEHCSQNFFRFWARARRPPTFLKSRSMMIMYPRSVKFPPCHVERLRFVSSPTLVKMRKRQKSALWVALSFIRNRVQNPEPRESDSGARATPSNRPSTSAVRRQDYGLPELSERSRAILKRCFDEAKSFNLPQGHPAVIFFRITDVPSAEGPGRRDS